MINHEEDSKGTVRGADKVGVERVHTSLLFRSVSLLGASRHSQLPLKSIFLDTGISLSFPSTISLSFKFISCSFRLIIVGNGS